MVALEQVVEALEPLPEAFDAGLAIAPPPEKAAQTGDLVDQIPDGRGGRGRRGRMARRPEHCPFLGADQRLSRGGGTV